MDSCRQLFLSPNTILPSHHCYFTNPSWRKQWTPSMFFVFPHYCGWLQNHQWIDDFSIICRASTIQGGADFFHPPYVLWGYADASPQNCLFSGPGFVPSFCSSVVPACNFVVGRSSLQVAKRCCACVGQVDVCFAGCGQCACCWQMYGSCKLSMLHPKQHKLQ